jgi:hypothetical protein
LYTFHPFFLVLIPFFIGACGRIGSSETSATSPIKSETQLTEIFSISPTLERTPTPTGMSQNETSSKGIPENIFEFRPAEKSYSLEGIADIDEFESGEYFLFEESLGTTNQESRIFYYIAADLSRFGTLFTIGDYEDRNVFPSATMRENELFICMHDLLMTDVSTGKILAYDLYIHGKNPAFAKCQEIFPGKENDPAVHIKYWYYEKDTDEISEVVLSYSIIENRIVSHLIIPKGYFFSRINSVDFLLRKEMKRGEAENPEYCFGDLLQNTFSCRKYEIAFTLSTITGNKEWAVIELPEEQVDQYFQEGLPERAFGEFLIPFQCLTYADLSLSNGCPIIPILAPTQLDGDPGILFFDVLDNSDTFIILHSIQLDKFTVRIWSWNKSSNSANLIKTLSDAFFSIYSLDAIWNPVGNGFFLSNDGDEQPIIFVSADGTKKTFPGNGAFMAGTIDIP